MVVQVIKMVLVSHYYIILCLSGKSIYELQSTLVKQHLCVGFTSSRSLIILMVHIECFGYVAKVSECSLPITVYVNGKMYM